VFRGARVHRSAHVSPPGRAHPSASPVFSVSSRVVASADPGIDVSTIRGGSWFQRPPRFLEPRRRRSLVVAPRGPLAARSPCAASCSAPGMIRTCDTRFRNQFRPWFAPRVDGAQRTRIRRSAALSQSTLVRPVSARFGSCMTHLYVTLFRTVGLSRETDGRTFGLEFRQASSSIGAWGTPRGPLQSSRTGRQPRRRSRTRWANDAHPARSSESRRSSIVTGRRVRCACIWSRTTSMSSGSSARASQ